MKSKLKQYEILIMIIFAAILSGGIGAFSKIALQTIPPLSFVFLRLVIATAVLLPFVWKELISTRFSFYKKLFYVSLFAAANFTLYIFGVAKTTATISQTLYAASPLVVAVLSSYLLKEKVSNKKILGLLVGSTGVMTIIILPAIGKPTALNGNILGNLLVMAAVLSWAVYTVLSKKLQKDHSPIVVNTAMALSTVVVQLFIAPIELVTHPVWYMHVSFASIIGVLYIGIFATAIYYLIYQKVIQKASPVTATLSFYLMPITSYIWAALLLGERLTLGFVAGAILALAGVFIVTNSK